MTVEPLQLLKSYFENEIPFNRHLGMIIDHLSAGECRIRIPFRSAHIGDPSRPALHGGVLSTLADAAGGLVVFSKLEFGSRVSTVDLRVDYLRPGLAADLICDASILRMGNKVAVTSMILTQDEEYRVAEGRAVYNVIREPSPSTTA